MPCIGYITSLCVAMCNIDLNARVELCCNRDDALKSHITKCSVMNKEMPSDVKHQDAFTRASSQCTVPRKSKSPIL